MHKQPSRPLFRNPVILLPGLLTLLFIALLTMAQQVAAATDVPEAPTVPPITKYYRIAAASSQYISTANDSASGSGSECTLRDALDIVNAGTTAGTVNGCVITTVGTPTSAIYVINLPTDGYTYTLNGSEMQINANTVYIVGANENNTILQANAVPNTAIYRVLNVGSNATVEIDHVTVRHGASPTAYGGGILNSGRLFVYNCILTLNQAESGGGIANISGNLTVSNTVISTNQTLGGSGGGIDNYAYGAGVTSIFTVTGGEFTANHAQDGGAIDTVGTNGGAAIAVIQNVVFGGLGSGNTADSTGGGIANFSYGSGSANLTLNHATFISNTGTYGGGIFTGGSAVLTVTSSSFYTNTSNSGGGISGSDITSRIYITGGIFSGNIATASGGGAITNNGPSCIIENSTFTSNSASQGYGGGIDNNAIITINTSAFYSNTATAVCSLGNCQGGNGGGINNWGALIITATKFAFNTATAVSDSDGHSGGGQGGAIDNSRTLSIVKSQFTNNTADGVTAGSGFGGAIGTGNWQPDMLTSLLVRDTVLTGNRALNGQGGAIYNNSGNGATSTVEVISSTISGNSSSDTGGGIQNFDTLTVTGSTISDNMASNSGGAIYNIGGKLTVTGTVFNHNRAINGAGGGIENTANGLGFRSVLRLTGGKFTANQAQGGGGGAAVDNYASNGGVATAIVESVVIGDRGTGNTAEGTGGGIANYSSDGGSAALTVNHSTFISNTSMFGGGVWSGGSAVLTITASSFYSNTANLGGGIGSSDLTSWTNITGCTFTDNTATAWGGGGMSNDGGSTSIIENSTFTGNKAFQGDGGGFRNGSGTVTIITSSFYTNTALAICTSGNCNGGTGGGAANWGTLVISATRFSYNTATATNDGNGHWGGGFGGAIENQAILSIARSQFTNNTANEVPEGGGIGGAINTDNWTLGERSRMLVRDSMFSGNRALGILGGAITNYSGNGGTSIAEIVNTTISGNTTNGMGGGISNRDILTITNSTIVNNTAAWSGDGIHQHNYGFTPTLFIYNSIIFNNSSDDCSGSGGANIASGDHNIVTNNGCTFNAITADPRIMPLADNGGSTLTHALLPGSPAIHAGNSAYCPATDQRGVHRSTVCDIGAYESQYKYTYLPLIRR